MIRFVLLVLYSAILLCPETSRAAFAPAAPAAQTAHTPSGGFLQKRWAFFPAPADGPQKPQQARTNGWAVASFACGLASLIPPVGLVLGPLALLFGVLALDARRRRKNRGLGLALAGMILGAIGFAAVFLLARPL